MIKSKSYLAGALAIHSVEACHAAWIRRLAGFLPAAHAFDDPLSDAKVVDIVSSTQLRDVEEPANKCEDQASVRGLGMAGGSAGLARRSCRRRVDSPLSSTTAVLERRRHRCESCHRQPHASCGTDVGSLARSAHGRVPGRGAGIPPTRREWRRQRRGQPGRDASPSTGRHGWSGGGVRARRAQRCDPDAAFNLGVLLYEAGDLDGAEAAWRRSAG